MLKNRLLLFVLCAGIVMQTCAMQRNHENRNPFTVKRVLLSAVAIALATVWKFSSPTPVAPLQNCPPIIHFGVVDVDDSDLVYIAMNGETLSEEIPYVDISGSLFGGREKQMRNRASAAVKAQCKGVYTCQVTHPQHGRGKCGKVSE